jgi:hypothetical protein
MSKREYRPPRPGDKVGDINGWPDSRGLPTVRVICEGRRDKGTAHKETVLYTFQCFPFDPSKGECGNWFWDEGVATGGGARHATTRLREDKAKRKVTEAEEEHGFRPGYVEVGPRHSPGVMQSGGTMRLKCIRCPSDLHLKEARLQEVLDMVLLAGVEDVGEDMAALLAVGPRKLPLPALILLETKPKGRRQHGESGAI